MAVYTKIATLTATITIASNTTTSAVVDLGASALLGIEVPAALDGTTLALHGASTSGGTYGAIRDADGVAVSITTAAGYKHYLDPAITAGWPYIKIVTGTVQTADRSFTLLVRPV